MGIVKYRGIEHERTEDAPFIGALLFAANCHHGCMNCFNQHLKKTELLWTSAAEIVKLVEADIFNQGIILGGLEWTEQPEELKDIVHLALCEGLQVMIYTHMTVLEFHDKFPKFFGSNIWVKFGEYREDEKTETNIQEGVKLASSNQCIINLKKYY